MGAFHVTPHSSIMIDVTLNNFEAEVIAASAHTPVLVDFWANWCAPCTTLGPILEKLETAYAGRFILAKIDNDSQTQLASAFGVRSLPTCILLIHGRPVDGFTGLLPESQIREFLDKHLPSVAEVEAQEDSDAAQVALDEGNIEAALEKMAAAVAADPDNDAIRFNFLRLLLQQGTNHQAQAQTVLQAAAARIEQHQGLKAIALWLQAIATASPAHAAALQQRVAQNKRDFAAWHQLALHAVARGAWTEALDTLLEILMRDKDWSDALARKDYILILTLMEPPAAHVEPGIIPPQDPTVVTYRRRLSSVVLS